MFSFCSEFASFSCFSSVCVSCMSVSGVNVNGVKAFCNSRSEDAPRNCKRTSFFLSETSSKYWFLQLSGKMKGSVFVVREEFVCFFAEESFALEIEMHCEIMAEVASARIVGFIHISTVILPVTDVRAFVAEELFSFELSSVLVLVLEFCEVEFSDNSDVLSVLVPSF